MRYKNISKGNIKFRAFNTKGEKVVFGLKPNEEVELGKEANHSCLEKVSEKENKFKRQEGK